VAIKKTQQLKLNLLATAQIGLQVAGKSFRGMPLTEMNMRNLSLRNRTLFAHHDMIITALKQQNSANAFLSLQNQVRHWWSLWNSMKIFRGKKVNESC
jgi:hypothetical protein